MAATGALFTKKSCSVAQGGKVNALSSEFISTGAKLTFDIRPDYYFPSLGGNGFGWESFFGLRVFDPNFTLQTRNDMQTVL